MYLFVRNRIRLILFNVGYRPPAQLDLEQTLELTKKAFGYELLAYCKFFKLDDAAKLIEDNADCFLDLGYASDQTLWKSDLAPREWVTNKKTFTRASHMTEKDYELMRQCLTEGMQSKLNWYKSAIVNIDWNDGKELEPNLKCPVLYIAGLKDYICVPQTFADQKKYIANLETVELDASQVEKGYQVKYYRQYTNSY